MQLSRRALVSAGVTLPALLSTGVLLHAGDRTPRVGVLISGNEADKNVQNRLVIFKTAMQKLGWIDGRNVRYIARWGNSKRERMSGAAAELAALAPDVVLTIGTPATAAMHRRSKAIPIVFAIVSDPIGDGFVESLSHPGGNVTGFITYFPEFVDKWVELLKETAPQTRRTGLLFNPRTAPFSRSQYLRPDLERASSQLAIEATMLPVESEADIRSALAELAKRAGGSVIVMPDSFMIANRDLIIALSKKYKLPVVYPFGSFAARGGLIAYGVNMADLTRRAAAYVDRVLKGGKPADLPVQAPTTFELAVNLKAAQSIGLQVPLSVLVRATDVIE